MNKEKNIIQDQHKPNDQHRITEFAEVVKAFLFATTGNYAVTKEVIRMYWEALSEYPNVKEKLTELAQQKSQHIPLADLVWYFKGGPQRVSAKEAFDIYLNAIRAKGVSECVPGLVDDPKAQAAFRQIGGARAINEGVNNARQAFYSAYEESL